MGPAMTPPDDQAPPGPLGWRGLYALVLGALALVIVSLLWLTEHFH